MDKSVQRGGGQLDGKITIFYDVLYSDTVRLLLPASRANGSVALLCFEAPTRPIPFVAAKMALLLPSQRGRKARPGNLISGCACGSVTSKSGGHRLSATWLWFHRSQSPKYGHPLVLCARVSAR